MEMREKCKGMLLVLSGPSGVGKGTLAKRLLQEDGSFAFSVSVTTRAPRPGERDGVDYFFVTEEEFQRMVRANELLEYAAVHTAHYGTPRAAVEERIRQGQNVLLDIDVQGGLQVMRCMPDCVSVFILPPSYTALVRRLAGRGTATREAIEKRMRNAPGEIACMPSYEYTVINDDLETAWRTLHGIVEAEKRAVSRCLPEMGDTVEEALSLLDE